jgi:uncharacterized protein (TIGR02246 family)
MLKRYVGRLAIVAVLAVGGCAVEDGSAGGSVMARQNEDIDAIRQLAADWRAGWLAGDVDLLLSLYANEPVLMSQDKPAIVGKPAIQALYEPVLKGYDIKSESTLKEVEAAGDWGFFWSTYSLTATPKAGGEPVTSKGKSLFIVRREPGRGWKISRLMDNSDGVQTDPSGK